MISRQQSKALLPWAILCLLVTGTALFHLTPRRVIPTQDRPGDAPPVVRTRPADPLPTPGFTGPASSPAGVTGDPLPPFQSARFQNPHIRESRIAPSPSGLTRELIVLSPEFDFPVLIREEWVRDPDRWRLQQDVWARADELLVRTDASAKLDAAALGERVLTGASATLGLAVVRLPVASFAALDDGQRDLLRVAGISRVAPHPLVFATFTPDDPGYASCWATKKAGSEGAWDIRRDSRISDRQPVLLAVVDTGSNLTDTDIAFATNPGEIPANGVDDDRNGYIDDVTGWNFDGNNANPHYATGHGAAVTRLAGAITDNALGGASPAAYVSILPIKALANNGSGSLFNAICAVEYAKNRRADVINCSFVGGDASWWQELVDSLGTAGVILVAGAGNDGWNFATSSNRRFPACAAGAHVVAVGATSSSDSLVGNTNFGAPYVDLFAPGDATSYASPIAASAVAWLIADDPQAAPSVIVQRLLAGVDILPSTQGKCASGGRLNLARSASLNPLRRPDGVSATGGPGSITVRWRDLATSETHYVIERATRDPAAYADPDSAANPVGWTAIVSNLAANSVQYTDTSVSDGVTYYYRVRAKSGGTLSPRSSQTRVFAVATGSAPLVAPSGLRVSGVTATAVSLAWTDEATTESAYLVERRSGSGSFSTVATLPANSEAYQNTGLASDTAYIFRVTAIRGTEHASSAEVTARTAVAAPTTPTNLSVRLTGLGTATLTWTDAASNESGYEVEVRLSSSTYGSLGLGGDLPANATSLVLEGLEAGASYTFHVRALGRGANSPWSGEVSLAVPAPLADEPGSVIPPGIPAPALRWLFTEGSGSAADDLATGLAASLSGGVSWEAQSATGAAINYALRFNGSGAKVTLSNSNLLNEAATLANRTIVLRFRTDSTGSRQVLFEEGGSLRGLNLYLDGGSLYAGGWNTPTSGGESGWSGTFLKASGIQPGRWYQVALVLRGGATVTSNALSLYVDGSLSAAGPGSQLWRHTDGCALGAVSGSSRFHDGNTAGPAFYDGLLDGLLIFNQALTASQISALNGGTVPVDRTVAAAALYFPFDEGTGGSTSSADSRLDGNFKGPVSWIDTAEPGNPHAISLGGGRVVLPDSLDINLAPSRPALTISFWFRARRVNGQRQIIFEQGGYDRGINAFIEGGRLRVGGWNAPVFESGWSGNWLISPPVAADRWYHVAIVLQGGPTLTSGAFRAYLNGALIGAAPGSQLWAAIDDTSIGDLAQTSRGPGGEMILTPNPFDGSVDSLAFFHAALRPEEIAALAAAR